MMRHAAICLILMCGNLSHAKQSADALAEQLVNDGWTMFLAGDLVNARARFEAAHQLVPNKAQPYRLLGLTDARLHHCDDALKSLDEFLRRIDQNDPRYSEAITVRDQCLAPKAAPLPSPAPVVEAPVPPPVLVAPPAEPPRPVSHRRAYLAVGVVASVLVVAGVAIGLAVGLSQPPSTPYDSAVRFPAVKGGM